jgi:hypothetical protein
MGIQLSGTAMMSAVLLAGCGGSAPVSSSASEPVSADRFMQRIAQHCGQAFAGKVLVNEPAQANDAFAGKQLVMHVRDCDPKELKVPFFVGDDRSRTWIITRTATGVRLKHDHRHEDGSPDENTMYGGESTTPGSEVRQEFPVDQESKDNFARRNNAGSQTNTWAMEIEPGKRFLYELSRPSGRLFKVEFDLTKPVATPPPAWGHK